MALLRFSFLLCRQGLLPIHIAIHQGGLLINFQPVRLEDKERLNSYLRARRYEGSECTFTNFFMWQKPYRIEWVISNDCLCIKASHGGLTYMLAPMGPEECIAGALAEMQSYFKRQELPFLVRLVTRKTAEMLEQLKPGAFAFQADRNNYDYVYKAVDLCDLQGRKYHNKRNHIKKFMQAYPKFEFCALTEDLVQVCIENELEWCEKRECDDDPSLRCEKIAIIEALTHFSELDYSGGLIFINGKVEAFTMGEPLNKDTAVIHVEKGNPDIRGIYSVINQQYCQHNWRDMTFINREEDMGIPGIRAAKEAYYPVMMIEKYNVTLR